MQKQRIKTHVVDCWRSLCGTRPSRNSELANRPAQVFDANDMEQVDAGCKYFLLLESRERIKLRK
jgi:hypothetical protein